MFSSKGKTTITFIIPHFLGFYMTQFVYIYEICLMSSMCLTKTKISGSLQVNDQDISSFKEQLERK